MIFLKLGGSLITDKRLIETPRRDVIERLAREISACIHNESSPVLLGHGSGSFGHATAKRYNTRAGVHDAAGWRGFAEVSVVAARLNRIVADALLQAGISVVSIAPSATAICRDGKLIEMDTRLIQSALEHGLAPLVMGDVALDSVRGGTIVSTEEVFAYLAESLPVTRILLAGETEGVYRNQQQQDVIPVITPQSWHDVQQGIGGSSGADVTGGMASKVRDMLTLVSRHPGVRVQIFSALQEGNLTRAWQGEPIGTTILRA
ncbi:MAG TPA: isopentenyl phosphate kinase [Anaerolineae bacterium]